MLARLASRPSAGQKTGFGERRRGISGVYKDITEVMILAGVSGKILRALGSEDKMLKLSSKIPLAPSY